MKSYRGSFFVFAVGFIFAALLEAQESATIWDSVYAEAQAARGKSVYTEHCAVCHGDDGLGGIMGPGLEGDGFMANYMNLGDLAEKIKLTMPASDPGMLTAAQTADLIAFLAMTNKWPAGEKELSTDLEALKQIKIVKK